MAPGGGQTTVGLTVAANMDVSGVLSGVKSMQGAFNGLKLPANLTSDALKQFDKLKDSLTKYRELMEKGPSTKGDLKQLEKLEKTIKSSFDGLSKVYDELSGKKIYLEADATAIKNAQKEIDQLKQDIQTKLGSIKFEFSSPTKGKVDIGLKELTSDMERAVKSSKVVSTSMKEMTNSLKSGNFTEASKSLVQIEQQATKLKGASVGLLKTFQQMGLIQFNKSAEDLYKSGEHVELLHRGFDKLRSVLSADDVELKQFTKSLEDAVTKRGELEKIGQRNYDNSIAKQAQDTNQLKQGYDQCAEAARGFAQQSLTATQQIEQLQQSTQYFFSLRNMINLLKRGIDEAVQSVKDLDKAMTETAVVTDYKVSDLWGMLPEYTKVANQLGATTQGAYETMTLYYQQGLDQQQAFELGAETMKMARIAGLDYAETTDMMTAALRGFNMELNETSAKRVNDVYSELAAITASDTEELGTAMQRTASIAASAGASFEGTTAFLAQAIETTREPAENIGTAMKTIVARFQELKKNPLEISEVDGEEVDYNKIDTALKTIGVDLKDTNGQFRDFDEVMLDISARWDSLSQAQQRYIATTAAGSRQQSRFIAMVSNYDRTMQLMEAANNSAGASDEQFGKTMDSLESKLNQLHNAWQAFTMGIANNSIIKSAVDGLTTFLTVTNNIIDKLSMGSGAIKSFLSVFAAFTGLKAAGRIANRAIGGLGGLIDPQSTFKEGFKGGAIKQGQTGTAQAKAISDPIVTAVNRIYGAITGKQAATNQTTQNTTADFKTFKDANSEMRNFLGGFKPNERFSITKAYGKINKLDDRQQKAVLQQLPGLQLSLQKNGITFNTADLSDSSSKLIKTFNNEINQGLKDNTIDSQGILQLFGTPDNFKKGMEARGPEYVKAAEEVLNKGIDKAKIQDEALSSKIVERDLLGAKWSDDQILEMAQKEADRNIKTLQEKNLQESVKGTASTGMEIANDIASVGQAAVMAGQGVAQLGMQLSNAGFEQAGQAVTNLGYQISSLGQIATSVGSIVGKISGAGGIGALVAANPVITALVAAVALLGGAFAVAAVHFKNIKKAGEEVTNTFKETSKSVEDNIAKLKSYQSEFATLSKGVDSNGNNVNLDDSQYQRYLEIVDDIAAINPDIVEGYNAQGHAIINNNAALAETLALQEQLKQETYDTYTSEASLQKLINARNINSDYKKIQTQENGVSLGYGHGNEGRIQGIGSSVPLAGDVSSIADKLGLVKDFDEATLKRYGIDSLEALKSGEEQAVKNFVKHRQEIEADLSNSGLKLNEGILKGFEKLGEDAQAFNTAIQPVYDNLLTNVSNSKIFDSIAPEFREALNMGLKDLASQDLDASEMSKAAKNMALKFANLTTGSGKYQDALDRVEEAQQKFADTLDETEYKADVQPAIDNLRKLKEEALSEGSAYGDALAEYLENQIQQISRFTEEGTTTIQEGLNTASDAISEAESALEGFNEATKKDFSTAAEDMRSIYDKIFETYKDSYGNELTKHTEGEGDNTFWTGAEALLSENKLSGGVDEVTKSLKKLEPWLREGKEGMDAFFMDVINNDKLKKLQDEGLIKLDENGWFEEIPEGQWEAVADALGISENLLTSMLNKARQFGLISFDNLDKVREALATGDSAITGATSNAKGQKALYVKEDTMRQNLREAGYNTKESQDKVIENLLKEQNVHMVKTMDNLSATTAKNLVDAWGVKDLPDLITKMSETGDYTRDEILDLAEKAGLGSGDTAAQTYDDIIQALDNPELAKQTSVLETISNQIAALTAGDLEEQAQAQKDFHDMINGGKGTDTAYEQFASGMDANGQSLDAGEYAETRRNLEDAITLAKKQAAEQKQWAEESFGTEHDKHVALAKAYEEDAKNLQDWLDSGEKAWEDAENRRARREQDQKTKEEQEEAKRKAVDYYNKNGFQNAGAVDRPEIKWGKDPTKNSNFRAATTWFEGQSDKQVANQLKGSTSTYLSQADTFTDLNGKTFSLAFTPVLAGANGQEGQVLSSDTVYQYLDQAITQATDKQGNINLDKLFEIDKEGLEIEGQQIKNLLMGAFTGEGQEAASGALGELEHQLEEIKLKTQENEAETQKWQRLTEQTKKNLATQNVNKEQEKGEKRTETVTKKTEEVTEKTETTTYDAEETDEAKKLKDEYSEDNTQDTERVIEYVAKGGDSLQSIAQKVSQIDNKTADPKVLRVETKADGVPEAEQEINNAEAAASKGADFSVTADYSQAMTAGNYLNSAAKTYNATFKASSSGLSGVSGALSSILSKIRSINSTPVSPKGGQGATGRRNHISHHSIPSFGSAAKGRRGTVGPKDKGGLTLTGEEGFEIAWIPSESRSMIVGLTGPQMLSLPSDTVIYTHKQSKDILKQKGIPAGSHSGPSARGGSSNYTVTYTSSSSSSTSSKTTPKKTTKPKKNQKPKKEPKPKTTSFEKAIKTINWWWDKTEKKLKKLSKAADRYNDVLEKQLSDIRASLKDVNKVNKKYVDNLQLQAKIAKKEEERAHLALSTNAKATTKTQKDQRQVDRSVTVSIKKGNKTKDTAINARKYVSYDKETGSYYADYKKIKKGFKGKENREAVYNAVNQWVDEFTGKLEDAKDAQTEALDKIDEYRKKIDDTFFGWENELTKVYKLTHQIELLEAKINKDKSAYSLQQTKLDDQDLSLGMTQQALSLLSSMKDTKDSIDKQTTDEIIALGEKRKATEAERKEAGALSDKNKVSYYDNEAIDKAEAKQTKAEEKVAKAKEKVKKAKGTKGKKDDRKAKAELEAAQKKLEEAKAKVKELNSTPSIAGEETRYNQIAEIADSRGTGRYWDGLSENDKKLYAKGRAFEDGYIGKNENGEFTFDEEKLKADKAAGKITSELFDLIKEQYDNLHQMDLDIIDADTQIIEKEEEQYKNEQQYLDTVKQMSEQLYGWKNTLTQILQLTNQIEQTEKRTALLKSADDYYKAKQQAGMPGQGVSSTEILSAYVGQMLSSVDQIQKRADLLGKQRQDLQDYIDGKDITNQRDNLKSLPQTDLTKARLEELEKEQDIRNKAKNYVKTTTNADGTVNVTYDSAGLEKDIGKEFDVDTAHKIEEYAQELVNKNNEIAETMSASLEDITSLYSALGELKQEYADRAKELREAYGAYQQKQIDATKDLYTAIDNNFKEVISQVRSNIEQRRQTEDNAKTEQDISKKQQRLAALRADTSGGHQVEIAQLQQEIGDAQQAYGRTLEDQKLDKISQQGDLAAQQRQQQIDLMQNQRDLAAKTGADAEQINQWLQNPEKYKSNITAVLQSEAGWAAMSEAEKKVFDNSLDTKLTDLKTLPEKINTTSATLATIKPAIEATEKNIKDTTKTAIDNIPTETLKVFDEKMKGLDGKIDVANSGIKSVAEKLDQELAKKLEADAAAAKKKADEEAAAAKKKADDEAAAKKKADDEAKQKAKDAAQKKLTNSWNAYKNINWNDASAVRGAHANLRGAIEEAQKYGIDTSNYSVDKALETFRPKLTPTAPTASVPRTANTGGNGAGATESASGGGPTYINTLKQIKKKKPNKVTKDDVNKLFDLGAKEGHGKATVLLNLVGKTGGSDPFTWKNIFKAIIDAKGITRYNLVKTWPKGNGTLSEALKGLGNPDTYSEIKKHKNYKKASALKFKTGGLANYTGPAWLDGTPSKPELVLNATDTQNFLALRDVLSKALTSTNSVTNSYGGDAMYEININVDHLSSDYDVDKVVEKVKKEIVKGSGYRNVTQVRNLR